MHMLWLTAIALILTITGCVVLLIGIISSFHILNIVPESLRKKWTTMIVLLSFFIIGYFLFIFVTYIDLKFESRIISSFVFLGGAIFVYITITISRKTITAIQNVTQLTTLVSNLKKSKRKILDQNNFLNSVIESLTHPFYVIDTKDYSIQIANTAAGLEKGSRKITCHALTHKRETPCSEQDDICPLKEVLRSKQPVTVEHIHYDAQGNPRNVEVNAYPIVDKKHNVKQMIEYSIDVTEKTQMLNQLQNLTKRLTETNNELSDAQKNLELLLDQKQEFIRMMGHDLKNPLGPILLVLPDIVQSEQDSEKKDLLDIIDRNIKKLKDVLFKSLELAKQNELGMKLHTENIFLFELVDVVINNNQMLLTENNIDVVNDIDKSFIIDADRILVSQVFENLISNAIKYSQKGKGHVKIAAREDNEFINVSVKDDGIGISQDKMNKVFQVFYSGKQTKHIMDSHGLGLSICKNIVEKHGGRIWVESSGLNQGSTFYFTLPKSRIMIRTEQIIVSSGKKRNVSKAVDKVLLNAVS